MFHCHNYVWKIYIMKRCVKRLIHLPRVQDIHPSAVFFFVHASKGNALNDILYFLVVFPGAILLSTQTVMIFGDQAISKFSYI